MRLRNIKYEPFPVEILGIIVEHTVPLQLMDNLPHALIQGSVLESLQGQMSVSESLDSMICLLV